MGNNQNTQDYSPLEISAYAAKNEMPDSGMTYIDWLLWYMLRDIYREYSAGELTKEQGAERKRQAMEIYQRECELNARYRELCSRVSELWKRLEEASSAYRKDRTLENADKMMEIVYGFV